MQKRISEGTWVTTSEAAAELRISRFTLNRLKNRADGLKPRIHYIATTPGKRAHLLWNTTTIREAMAGWTSSQTLN
jgi:hypothetical protein